MMKMASGDDLPLQQGARTVSQLVFHGCIGLRRRNFSSRVLFGGFRIYRRGWRRFHVKGPMGSPQGRSTLPRGGARPLPCHRLGTLLDQLLCSGVLFWFIKNHRKVSAHSENFYFYTKNTTMIVLLKTSSVRVSSNQIIPKPYKIVVNMA